MQLSEPMTDFWSKYKTVRNQVVALLHSYNRIENHTFTSYSSEFWKAIKVLNKNVQFLHLGMIVHYIVYIVKEGQEVYSACVVCPPTLILCPLSTEGTLKEATGVKLESKSSTGMVSTGQASERTIIISTINSRMMKMRMIVVAMAIVV